MRATRFFPRFANTDARACATMSTGTSGATGTRTFPFARHVAHSPS